MNEKHEPNTATKQTNAEPRLPQPPGISRVARPRLPSTAYIGPPIFPP
jgi:hypothetical protein